MPSSERLQDRPNAVKIGPIGITILVGIVFFAGRQFTGTGIGPSIDQWVGRQLDSNQWGLFLYHMLAWWVLAEVLFFGAVAFGVLRCTPRQVFLLPGRSSWSFQKTIGIVLLVAVCEVAIILTTNWANLSFAFHPGDMAGNLFSNAYEELLFRGFIFGMLIRFSGSPWYAILVTSLLFTLVHGQYDGWILLGFFLLAIPFAWITWKTQWIFWAWILHMLVDWAVDPLLPPDRIADLLSRG